MRGEQRCLRCGGLNGAHGLVHARHGNGGGSSRPCPNARPVVVTYRARTRWARLCDGCGVTIMAEAEHLEHRNLLVHSSLFECMTCALKNGRPEVAEPDVPEVPLVWDGIA